MENSIAVASDQHLKLVCLDDIEKLHVRKLDLGFTARRIVHQKTARAFGIVGTEMSLARYEETETSRFVILDESTFDGTLSCYRLWIVNSSVVFARV